MSLMAVLFIGILVGWVAGRQSLCQRGMALRWAMVWGAAGALLAVWAGVLIGLCRTGETAEWLMAIAGAMLLPAAVGGLERMREKR